MPLALIITLSGYASSRSGPNLLPLAAVRASTDLTSAKETVCGSFIHVTRGNGNPAFATAIVVWAADHEGKDALTKREVEAYWKGTSRKLAVLARSWTPSASASRTSRWATRCVEFHLASRQIVDDLWANVAAHLWGSQYAIAFFEKRTRRGLNYNLTIEVGSTLVLGRRLAILKDVSVETLPVDLVGRIYKSVDLADADTVATALHVWCRDDLNLGRCPGCPKE